MTQYSSTIANMRYKAESSQELKQIINDLESQYTDKFDQYKSMLKAQRVLATVSDANSKRVLGFIQGIINKALRTMFPNEVYNVEIIKELYANRNPHINVILTEHRPDGTHHKLDFALQSGDGMGQIVSFLFSLCLMQIRGARPLVVLDEVLKGFHEEALPYVRSIIEIFAKSGFQFIMVEYDLDNIGKEYLVDKKNGVATLSIYDRDALSLDEEQSEEQVKEEVTEQSN